MPATTWFLLECTSKWKSGTVKVLVKEEVDAGDSPSISLRVHSLHSKEFLGSFGGRLHYTGSMYDLTCGNMRLAPEKQGFHIGTWCQNRVIEWVKDKPILQVRSIHLAEVDACVDNRERRNRFYEQFGFRIRWSIEGIAGRGDNQDTSELMPLERIDSVKAVEVTTALSAAIQKAERLEVKYDNLSKANKSLCEQLDSCNKTILGAKVVAAGIVALAIWALRFY